MFAYIETIETGKRYTVKADEQDYFWNKVHSNVYNERKVTDGGIRYTIWFAGQACWIYEK